MRKIVGLLSGLLLVSCTCLSQIPPQTVYADNNCQAVLPDYTTVVVVIDNCPDGVTITQSPVAGTMLSTANPTYDVIISAVDISGNISNTLTVPVILLDTIAPILEWPVGQIASSGATVGHLWSNLLSHTDMAIAHFLYDMSWTQGMPLADTTQIMENLHWFTFKYRATDEQVDLYTAYMDNQE